MRKRDRLVRWLLDIAYGTKGNVVRSRSYTNWNTLRINKEAMTIEADILDDIEAYKSKKGLN